MQTNYRKIGVVISLNNTQFIKGLNQSIQKLNQFALIANKSVNNINRSLSNIKKVDKDVFKVNQPNQNLSNNFKQAEKNINNSMAGIAATSSKTAKTIAKDFNNVPPIVVGSIGSSTSKLTNMLDKSSKEIDKILSKIDKIKNPSTDKLGLFRSNKSVESEIKKTSIWKKSLLGVKKVLGGINSFMNKLRMNFLQSSEAMAQAGMRMSIVFTAAIAMIGKQAFKLAKDFDFSMSKITSLVGVARNVVTKWKDDLLDLSSETGQGLVKLAEGLYFITSSGIRGSESLDILKQSAKAAAAGLGEVKDIANLITSVMNAYGKSNISSTETLNTLITAVKEGKAEASDFATYMGKVLPIAVEMGVEFNEVAAAIAGMTRTGTGVETSTIELRQMLGSLLKPTKAAMKAFAGLNLSIDDVLRTIKQQGLLEGFIKIRRAADEMGKAGEKSLAKIFGNIRALTGFLDLTGQNLVDNIKIFHELESTVGTLDKTFNTASETIKVQYDQSVQKLKNNFLVLGETLQTIIIPLINKLADIVKWLSEKYSNLNPNVKKFITAITLTVAVIGPLLLIIGTLGSALAALSGPLLIIIGALGALSTGFLMTSMKSNTLADKIENEKEQLNFLVGAINDSNTTNEERKKLIDELIRKYPILISYIDQENGSIVELENNLNKINDDYEIKIDIAINKEEIVELEKQLKNLVKLKRKWLEKKYNANIVNSHIADKHIEEINKQLLETREKIYEINKKNAKLQEKTISYWTEKQRQAQEEYNLKLKRIEIFNEKYGNKKDLIKSFGLENIRQFLPEYKAALKNFIQEYKEIQTEFENASILTPIIKNKLADDLDKKGKEIDALTRIIHMLTVETGKVNEELGLIAKKEEEIKNKKLEIKTAKSIHEIRKLQEELTKLEAQLDRLKNPVEKIDPIDLDHYKELFDDDFKTSGAPEFIDVDNIKRQFDNANSVVSKGYLAIIETSEFYGDLLQNVFMEISNTIIDFIETMQDPNNTLSFGENIENAMSTFLHNLGNMAIQYGSLLIAMGIALQMEESGNPYAMIIAGAALVGIGVAMSSIFSSFKNANPGSPNTPSDSNYTCNNANNYDYNREVEFKIKGYDLVGVLNKNSSKIYSNS